MAERVVLIDGTAMIYRAFFAIPSNFSTGDGLPTNAIYGFALMFRKVLAGKTPALGAVVFDAKGKTFRDEKYPKYKANRPPMMADLRRQIPWVHRVVAAHDFPILTVPGYEADDVIGTLTRRAVALGHEVHIISGDKDFAQLLTPKVKMVDTMRDVTYDPELAKKKWGVPPSQFVDMLALVGDKADNIPGVPGIGKKGAAKLLDTYGSLDAILENVSALKGRQKKNLEEYRDDALMSRELATIDQHVPLDALAEELAEEAGFDDQVTLPVLEDDLSGLTLTPPDIKKVDALYQELEFFSLLSEGAGKTEVELTLADTLEDIGGAVAKLKEPVAVWFMMEGAWNEGELLGVALSDEETRATYVPVSGKSDHLAALAPFFESPLRKTVHHARDMEALLRRRGITLRGVDVDPALASFLVEPVKNIPHRIDQVARGYLHRALPQEKSVTGSGKGAIPLRDVETERLAEFAGQHVTALFELRDQMLAELDEAGQREVFENVSMPLASVLARMQVDGVRADPAVLAKMGEEFGERKRAIEAEIYEHAGKTFNIGSPKQLAKVLFEDLELPVIKRTKTGYSTNAEVLTRLKGKHPIPALVLRQRALDKLINTYTTVLRDAIREDTGRIHCTFQQTSGMSGRLITTDPDLQRTPIRTPDGRRIREAFLPADGMVMISADWSQVELRVMAHVSEDEALTTAFREELDIHRRTAAQIFDVAEDKVTKEQRGVGKTVNFATIYGQGGRALGQNLGVPFKEATRMIEAYFEMYAGVREWLTDIVEDAYANGYVETVLGRRRYISELSSNNSADRSYGERIATNTPIQGSAADLCKLAMLKMAARFREEELATKMLLQIHDELVFEAPPEEVERATAIIRDCMENAFPLSVPLVVDVGTGASWAEAH